MRQARLGVRGRIARNVGQVLPPPLRGEVRALSTPISSLEWVVPSDGDFWKMSATVPPLTANELFQRPEDGFRYELIKGELRRMTPAGDEHGRVGMRLSWRLAQFVETHGLGAVYLAETGFKIASNPDTVRAPDVAFVTQARLDAMGEVKGYRPEAPALAVEVVSPRDTYSEVAEKAMEWLEAGTSIVLVVDPSKRTVTQYRSLSDIVILHEPAILDLGEVVDGFQVPIRELFG